MKIISIAEAEYIAHRLAKKFLEYDVPIPASSTRFANVLESSLAVPFQKFGQKDAYSGLVGKAAILFYLLIKNHPFQNGNKRIAMTTIFVFLYKNKRWLKVDNQELYNFAVWVAQSPAKLKDQVTAGIEKFLKIYMVNI